MWAYVEDCSFPAWPSSRPRPPWAALRGG